MISGSFIDFPELKALSSDKKSNERWFLSIQRKSKSFELAEGITGCKSIPTLLNISHVTHKTVFILLSSSFFKSQGF